MTGKILAKGTPANSGITTGIIKIVKSISELSKVNEGDIIVVENSNPAWTVGMMKAAALISEKGGIISHAAIVAREIGVPCAVSVENASSILRDGQKVKVDGAKGEIYDA